MSNFAGIILYSLLIMSCIFIKNQEFMKHQKMLKIRFSFLFSHPLLPSPTNLIFANKNDQPIPSPRMGQTSIGGIAPENALDALLDELQTFAKPPNHNDQQQVVFTFRTN